MMPDLYRIFDTTICCEFPLPELPRVAGEDFTLSVAMGEGDPGQYDSLGFETAFEWCDHEGRIVCWCDRMGDEYLFVFPGNAAFHITSENVITCFLQQGSSMQMLRHLLLNQAIPRYLATMGRLVLHAGAVKLPNGQSVAVLGNSGFGKSTLVSSFHRNGAQLINDDCILLE
jgi:ABC-type multidrug transport system fused ATPase/permease subunit